MRGRIVLLLSFLIVACGGKGGGGEDTATDQPADLTDTAGDTTADPAPDPEEDTPVDAPEDTAEDVPVDSPADTPLDTPEEAEDVHVDDPGTDPDAEPDTPFDIDAADDSPADTSPEPCPDAPDADGSGTFPYILTSAKGLEYPTGTPCNPDGSFTEMLELAAFCSGCIHAVHYCAWLNCCSTLSPSLTYAPPFGLEIVETEIGPWCLCEGYFSPRYEVCGLTAGLWSVDIDTLSETVTVP